jgi:hypothetical protein
LRTKVPNRRLNVSVQENGPIQEIEEIIVLRLVLLMEITLVDIEKVVEEEVEGLDVVEEEEEEATEIVEVLIINHQDTRMVSEFDFLRSRLSLKFYFSDVSRS